MKVKTSLKEAVIAFISLITLFQTRLILKKTEVLEKLFSTNVPFAMLLGVVGIFESKNRFDLFKNNKFEVMYFDKRISYMRDYTSGKTELNPPFSSVYICHNVLPQQIVFEEVNKKNIL
jgi:sugar-phospahte nucleotidyltransferase